MSCIGQPNRERVPIMRNPTRQSVVTSDQADAAVTLYVSEEVSGALVIGSTGPDAVEVEVDPKSELGKIIAAFIADGGVPGTAGYTNLVRAAKATPAE